MDIDCLNCQSEYNIIVTIYSSISHQGIIRVWTYLKRFLWSNKIKTLIRVCWDLLELSNTDHIRPCLSLEPLQISHPPLFSRCYEFKKKVGVPHLKNFLSPKMWTFIRVYIFEGPLHRFFFWCVCSTLESSLSSYKLILFRADWVVIKIWVEDQFEISKKTPSSSFHSIIFQIPWSLYQHFVNEKYCCIDRKRPN